MTRNKIDYGIDLGTTNSAIARMENGEPVIKKTDTLKDTLPSCVGFNKKKFVLVGDSALNSLKSEKLRSFNQGSESINTFIEFKRTMGTDKKYHSSHMERSFNSEELSSEILKKLRSFITDDEVNAVIITVPAKFDIRQKDATIRAAKLAGFRQFELVQEPIAASMAYGLDSKNKNGYWIVFDFGGGTFDAALIKVEDGIMKVIDTDGDNYLGGKNLDMAIVDELIIPFLKENFTIEKILSDDNRRKNLQDAMKYYAEEAKIQLSFKNEHNILSDLGDIPGKDDNGDELELDITVNREDIKKVLSLIFQRSIDITKQLLKRNNLNNDKIDSLILVGGPTYSPVLREMLQDQIIKPDTSIDPMTAVAVGAALYASTVDLSDEIRETKRDKTKIQLDLGYQTTSVENEEWVTVKTLPEKTNGKIPDKIYAEVVRGDKSWSSGKIEINEKGEIIEVKLIESRSNQFEIFLYDYSGNKLACQPDQFTILQGIGGADKAAILPHNIGIEIDVGKSYSVFEPIKGLEKNVSIPAKGTANGLKTQKDIRPGNSADYIEIALYQGETGSKGTRASYNELIYKVRITGDELPGFLPQNSDVDLTITTDKSSGRLEKLDAYFPYLDYSLEVPIPENPSESVKKDFLKGELTKGTRAIKRLKSSRVINQNKVSELEKELDYQEKRFEQGENDDDRRNDVLTSIKKLFRQIDELEGDLEWPKVEDELSAEIKKLEKANEELGNEKTNTLIEQVRSAIEEVKEKKDVNLGKALLEEIHQIYFAITFIYQLIGFIRHYSQNFDMYPWSDRQKARQTINEAERIIVSNPTKEDLHPLVLDLITLLPKQYVENTEVGSEILRKG